MTDRSEPGGRLDDQHYPAYSMGAAADLLGVTPAFLRSLDESGLLAPQRSGGGHRRYSRHQLQLAARVRELLDQGMALSAACRVVDLEDQVTGLEGQVTGLEDQVSGLADRLSQANRRIRLLQRDARRRAPSGTDGDMPPVEPAAPSDLAR